MLFIVLGVVILASAGIWIAGSRIQSPAEAAARIAPPTPSPILVPVQERVLTSDVVARGTARFGLPQSISIVPSPLKPGAGIISTLPSRNMQIQEGDVLLTASGRPVFVLQGAIPVFRDLASGLSGEDVHQLESGLERLGFDPGPVDGKYDEQTGKAVADWYASAGFELLGPTAEQLAKIHALEDELAVVRNDLLAAQEAAAAAPLAVEAARAKAAYELATADFASKTAVQLAGDVAMIENISTEVDRGEAVNLYTFRWGLPDRFGAGVIGTYGSLGGRRFRTNGAAEIENMGFYLQDSWSIRPNFTLNVGVRTEQEEVPNYGANVDPTLPANAIEFDYGDKVAPASASRGTSSPTRS